MTFGSCRYGENGTISLSGLRRLLRSVGLDHIRTVTIQHHPQPGQQHHHSHPHDHHHHGNAHLQDHGLGDAERLKPNRSSGAAEVGRYFQPLGGGGELLKVTHAVAFSAACLQCLNASSILSSHGMSQNVGVSFDDFSILCPALLHQIDDGACIVHGGAAAHGERGTATRNFTDGRQS